MKPTVKADAGFAASGAAAEADADGAGAEGLLQANADSANEPETRKRDRRDQQVIVIADRYKEAKVSASFLKCVETKQVSQPASPAIC
jgi:hypothetical protein